MQEKQEMEAIHKVALKHAQVVDASSLKYKVAKDPYKALMAIVKDLKEQGWTNAWICGSNDNPHKHITVWPPSQKQPCRGQYFPAGAKMPCSYCIYMEKA